MATTVSLRDTVAKRKAERQAAMAVEASKLILKQKPKTLAELRARKAEQNHKPRPKTLAELRASKGMKTSKHDFRRGGILYHNVHQVNGYWTVDVTNNDISFTMNNRYGSWLHSLADREGFMKEPAAVARMLGTNIGQQEMAENLIERVQREMKARGIPTPEELLRQREEEAKVARRRNRKQSDQD